MRSDSEEIDEESSAEDIQTKDHIGAMNAKSKSDFNKKWNWILLCETIKDFLSEPYYTTLYRNLYEVLTFATMLTERVETLKLK